MDFINWWFAQHYVISTLLMPAESAIYGIYKDDWLRFFAGAFLWCLFNIIIEAVKDK